MVYLPQDVEKFVQTGCAGVLFFSGEVLFRRGSTFPVQSDLPPDEFFAHPLSFVFFEFVALPIGQVVVNVVDCAFLRSKQLRKEAVIVVPGQDSSIFLWGHVRVVERSSFAYLSKEENVNEKKY